MNGAVTVVGADEALRYVGKMPRTLYDRAKGAFRDASLAAHRDTVGNLKGDPLQSRTGSLGRSILPEAYGSDLASLGSRVYSTSRYAPIHEYGGTVTAIDKYRGVPGGPYLNIPTKANKTPAGVMRMNARQVFSQGGYIAPTSRSYGVYLDGQLMFVLVKQVEIPARLGMASAAEKQVPVLIEALRNMKLDDETPEGW